METQLSLEMLRVVENAAIASARTMGLGDRHSADQAAVEAMRQDDGPFAMDGTIVIGEGERDEAPMLYIGEKVGAAHARPASTFPQWTSPSIRSKAPTCAPPARPNSITVLAASEKGGLLHAPDCYMEKIIVGPACKGAVDLDAPVNDNLKAIARRLDRDVDDLVIIVLDRPRHEKLIDDIRAAGARIRLIGDGDLSAGIAAAVLGTGVHAVMGTGGAPEGVLTAAALRCLNGEILARLVVQSPNTKSGWPRWASRTSSASTHRRSGARQADHLRVHRASPTATCCAACASSATASARIRWSMHPRRPAGALHRHRASRKASGRKGTVLLSRYRHIAGDPGFYSKPGETGGGTGWDLCWAVNHVVAQTCPRGRGSATTLNSYTAALSAIDGP